MFLDLTFGAGGHTKGLLNRNPQSIVNALDRDQYAIELAQQLAKEYPCETNEIKSIKNILCIEIDYFHIMDNSVI